MSTEIRMVPAPPDPDNPPFTSAAEAREFLEGFSDDASLRLRANTSPHAQKIAARIRWAQMVCSLDAQGLIHG